LGVIIGCIDPPESSLNIGDDNLDWIAQNEAVVAEETYYDQSDNANDRGKYISWTDEMDRCLTQLLVEQVMLGNKLEKNFKPVAYTAALTVLNDKFGLDLTKENIRNRLKTWKKQYRLVMELLSHCGFEWDERCKMVVANASDWNEYIKVLYVILQIDSMFLMHYFSSIIYVMFHHCSLTSEDHDKFIFQSLGHQ
jgi:hypothetical protein